MVARNSCAVMVRFCGVFIDGLLDHLRWGRIHKIGEADLLSPFVMTAAKIGVPHILSLTCMSITRIALCLHHEEE
jgi:hypothetical protein